MLINFTNHPLSQWSEEQKKEAFRLFEEVIDMEFPLIPPHANEEEIENLAEEYCSKILEYKLKYPAIAVHIMGEMTFSFSLIQKLKKHNIPCYASTTERIVENIDGKLLKTFKFSRFRKYL